MTKLYNIGLNNIKNTSAWLKKNADPTYASYMYQFVFKFWPFTDYTAVGMITVLSYIYR